MPLQALANPGQLLDFESPVRDSAMGTPSASSPMSTVQFRSPWLMPNKVLQLHILGCMAITAGGRPYKVRA
jgi:hypothetical protein